MPPIDFFKLQAKNLFRDYKTRYYDENEGFYCYRPRWLDIDEIFIVFDVSDELEQNFTLMQAQHIIAQLLGYEYWNQLSKQPESELQLLKLLWDHQDKTSVEAWEDRVREIEYQLGCELDAENKIEIFEHFYLKNSYHDTYYAYDYRIAK